MNSIEILWKRIDTWFSAHALSVWDPSSSPGASEEDIQQAEAAMGVILSQDFKASYRLHNGGWPFPPWLKADPLVGIVGVWEMFKDHWEQGDIDTFPDEPAGPVQPFHWHPKWVPFVWGGYGGDYVCLDLEPGPGGQMGQVILRTHEVDPATLIASRFETWLAIFADELEAGKYVTKECYDPISGVTVPCLRLGD